MSHVACDIYFFGGEGDRAKIGTSSGWQVSHPLSTPHLVLIRTTIVVYCNSFDSVENLKSAKYFRFSKISNFYIFEIRTFIIHTFKITPWRVSRLKDCKDKEILPQRWKVTRLEGWEEKQVLPQGWRVNRLACWEKKQVLPEC